jgi:hypothetical protein
MLSKFKDIHEGKIGLIIGNGPSLMDCPRELLDKHITFGANKVFILEDYEKHTANDSEVSDEIKDKLKKFDGFTPDYYTIIDELMLNNCAPYLANGRYKPDAMFIRRPYPIKGCYHINTIVHSGWAFNINKAVVMGGTVTYASLQIAHYMGIRTALLVGVDHTYIEHEGAPQGAIFQADCPDPDHFHPGYFTQGNFFAAPALEGSHDYYRIARMVYEEKEGRVINLTPGTKETAFEKGTYDDWV